MNESVCSARVEFRFAADGKRKPSGYDSAEPGGLAGHGTIDREGVLTAVEVTPGHEALVERIVAGLNERERVMVRFGGSRKFSTAGKWFYRYHPSFLTALKDYCLRSYAMVLAFKESDLGAESYESLHPTDWPTDLLPGSRATPPRGPTYRLGE